MSGCNKLHICAGVEVAVAFYTSLIVATCVRTGPAGGLASTHQEL